MQPQSRRGISPWLVIGLVIGSSFFGAIVGGAVTYGILSASPLAARGLATPVGKTFGHPGITASVPGWWKHTFSDLDLSIELPDKMRAYDRSSTGASGYEVSEADDYIGAGAEARFQLGACWSKSQRSEEPSAVAKRTSRHHSETAKFEAMTIDGYPACQASGSYTEGDQAGFLAIYIKRGNGIYYIQSQFWNSQKSEAESQWTHVLRSIHFLGRAPLIR